MRISDWSSDVCSSDLKRAAGVIPLTQYVADGVMTQAQADALRAAVLDRRNILIAGGTSSGKTKLANALLQEMAETGDRVILLADPVELQRLSNAHLPLRPNPGVPTLTR